MANTIPLKLTPQILIALAVLILGVGFGLGKYVGGRDLSEGFRNVATPICSACRKSAANCGCSNAKGIARLVCPPCKEPDLSKYVLKSSIPPCPACPDMSLYMLKTECPPVPDLSKYVLKSSIPPPKQCPDMSQYMLKTECPPTPDLSQYVLKSSIPKQEPVIIDNSACKKDCGECPACPRPRCPEIKCPPPNVCPACPPCPRQACPEQKVQCKAVESAASSNVRPYLAPLNFGVFGGN